MKREDFVFDHMDDEYEDYWFKVVGDTKDELTKKYMEMCMVSVTEVVYSNKEQALGVKRLFPFNYPPFVRLFISRDKTQIALQPCAKETPNAMKFFTSDSTKDGKPKKRMIPVGNRALTALVKAGIGVEMNVPLKAPGVRFADEGVIIFDLKQATDMNQPNACTETGLCLIPTPAYPFVEMPSGYFAS